MEPFVSGSCQCDAVRFEIVGNFDGFMLCHCSRCRKDTGSAHAANLFASSAQITWRCGQDKVRQYQVPGTRHAKAFCSGCGSALPSLQMDGTVLVVPAGSLDSEIAIRPSAHICCDARATWDDGLEMLPKLPGLPA